MRLHFILLLSAVALLSSIDAASATTSSKFLAGDVVDTVAKRNLRADTAVDDIDSDEERGFVLPGFAQTITNAAKSSVQNVKVTVSQMRVDMKFQSLELTAKGSLSSPDMKKWADSVLKLYKNDAKKSTNAMLKTLTKHYDQTVVARWAQAAKDSPQVGYMCKNLQVLQFTKWMDEGKDALGLAKMLRKTATSSDTQQDKVLVQAFAAFIKQRKSA